MRVLGVLGHRVHGQVVGEDDPVKAQGVPQDLVDGGGEGKAIPRFLTS